MRIGKEFWNSDAAKEVFRADASEEVILHSQLAKLVKNRDAQRVLDFGCGDGALLTALDPNIEVDFYDPNQTSAKLAEHRCRAKKKHRYEDLGSIKTNHYDVVVLSFVLICLKDEEELMEVLLRIKSYLREGGQLIVAECHPCFRDEKFVGHCTEYSPGDKDDKKKPFPYNARFHKFQVELHGYGEEVKFYDYHWTLSDIVNTILGSGLALSKIHELKDSEYDGQESNPHFPPYLVICATKPTTNQ